jgi:AcrR family transcriptional regulator
LTSGNEILYGGGVVSAPSTAEPASQVVGVREAQRLQTRARVFDAALAEFRRSGLAGADVAAIAATAGVSRGTFYFHFPTKEHVLVELERAEEAKIVATLDTRGAAPDDLLSLLTLLVGQVLAAEERLGPVVFKDMLALHFSATRPIEDELGEHPLAGYVIATIAEAQAAGRVSRDADPGELGTIFLTGLFALLAIGGTASLDRYVLTIVQGMEER